MMHLIRNSESPLRIGYMYSGALSEPGSYLGRLYSETPLWVNFGQVVNVQCGLGDFLDKFYSRALCELIVL